MATETDTAIVMAAASMAVTVISMVGTWRSQRKAAAEAAEQAAEAAAEQGRLSRDLAALESRLAVENDAARAKQDYEYEARKRLYSELYPLAFQLNEAALAACNRVKNLARAARDGHLGRNAGNWLDFGSDDYYFTSTLYSLLAPLALHEMMTRRLTLFDLNLDPHLQRQRFFSRLAYQCLRSDFDFADSDRYGGLQIDPADPNQRYGPADGDDEVRGGASERWLWRQGVYSGRVGQAVDALLTKDGNDATRRRERVMSYAEFAKQLGTEDLRSIEATSSAARALRPFASLLRGFHPYRRPVTWRILLAQVCCYRMILALPSFEGPLEDLLPKARIDADVDKANFNPLGADASDLDDLGMDRAALESEYASALEAGSTYMRQAVEQFGRDHARI